MTVAAYSERHYELAINIELVSKANEYVVPTQNEEKDLGWDIALVPALPKLWASLTEGTTGVGEDFGHGVPSATSLFLQYKRPEYLWARNAKEASKRKAAFRRHTPYYRFKLDKEQLERLLQLQSEVKGRARVCYAAGVFHKRSDFYGLKTSLSVAEHSVFVTLEEVRGALEEERQEVPETEHHVWSYDENGHNGLLNSEPRPLEGMGFEGLKSSLQEQRREAAEPLLRHVTSLSDQLQAWMRTIDRSQLRTERARLEPGYELLRVDEISTRFAEIDDMSIEARSVVEMQQTLDEAGIGWFVGVPVERRQR